MTDSIWRINSGTKKRQAENQTRKTEKVDMYKGLTSIEISVLKLLESGEKLTVDSMSGLGIPLPKLLSVLTVLEIKKTCSSVAGRLLSDKQRRQIGASLLAVIQ